MAGLIAVEHIRQALDLPGFDSARARQRMAPVPRGWRKRDRPPKCAAVLILIYPLADGRLHAVLTLRNADLSGHSGQVSFPGGGREAQDASMTDTALRETCEEIGICGQSLSIIGSLPRFYIPVSHYDVYPTVAFLDRLPYFAPNSAEVAEIFSFALEDLLRPRFKCVEQRVIRGHEVRVPYYKVQGHKVWGATAMMLSELEGRLRQILPRGIALELA